MLNLITLSECVVHTTTYPTYYWSRVGPGCIAQEHAAPDTCVTRNTGSVLVISPKSIVARHRPRAQPWPQASLTRLLRLYHRENTDLMLHLYTLNTVSNRRFIAKANYKLRRILVV